MKPLLEKYFYPFVSLYCGDLQDGVTNYTMTNLTSAIKELSDVLRTYPRSLEHPPIWGPGLIDPPGGPAYRNRYREQCILDKQ